MRFHSKSFTLSKINPTTDDYDFLLNIPVGRDKPLLLYKTVWKDIATFELTAVLFCSEVYHIEVIRQYFSSFTVTFTNVDTIGPLEWTGVSPDQQVEVFSNGFSHPFHSLKKKLFQWISVTRNVKRNSYWTGFHCMTGVDIWNLLIHLMESISLSSNQRVSSSYARSYIRRSSHRSLNMAFFIPLSTGLYSSLV